MPFQIFNGRTGQQRLILVDPQQDDQATVVLEDGTKITVQPLMSNLNGYPGIKVAHEDLPEAIANGHKHAVRLALGEARAIYARSEWFGDIDVEKLIEEVTERLQNAPVMCANIVIGREFMLVLSKSFFREVNKFVLPAVKEFIIPPTSRQP